MIDSLSEAMSSVHIGSEVIGNEMMEVKTNTSTNTRNEFTQMTQYCHCQDFTSAHG